MARMRTLRSLLALIQAAGGRLETRIKVQKEAFLLAALRAGGFDHSAFSYHHYGPYSRELSDALQFAVSSDLLAEVREPGAAEGSRYSYVLTEQGRQFVSDAGALNDTEQRLVEIMNRQHWRTLELAATVRFLEMRATSIERSDAFLEATRLKPETKPYEGSARALLESLSFN